MDMLVNLNRLPALFVPKNVRVVRALPPDRQKILDFVAQRFPHWVDECHMALSVQPNACFIAVREGRIVGFACYDARHQQEQHHERLFKYKHNIHDTILLSARILCNR